MQRWPKLCLSTLNNFYSSYSLYVSSLLSIRSIWSLYFFLFFLFFLKNSFQEAFFLRLLFIILLNRFIVDHHAPGAGTVVTSSSGGQSERKLRLGCASRLPLPTGDREEGIKPEFLGCRCNCYSQLRDKGKHYVLI